MAFIDRFFVLGLLLPLACGPQEPGDGDGSGSDGSTTNATTSNESVDDTSSATDDASTGGDSTGGDSTGGDSSGGDSSGGGEPDGSLGMGHGVVLLELLRGQAEADDPFVGTERVEVTLLYLECLSDFYDANPDWQQSGPAGLPVFDAALGAGGLCDWADPAAAECQAVELDQELSAARQLTVTYDITGSLENRQLRFGPLPATDLASCAEGQLPVVRVGSNGSVRGLDAAGETLWVTESFTPQEAAVDQTAPITFRATRAR